MNGVWIAIIIIAAWVVATQVWVINAMRRLTKLERMQSHGVYKPTQLKLTKVDTKNVHRCDMCQATFFDSAHDSTETYYCPDCYEVLWNRPYKRSVMGGMYEKDSATGEVTERRQDDE